MFVAHITVLASCNMYCKHWVISSSWTFYRWTTRAANLSNPSTTSPQITATKAAPRLLPEIDLFPLRRRSIRWDWHGGHFMMFDMITLLYKWLEEENKGTNVIIYVFFLCQHHVQCSISLIFKCSSHCLKVYYSCVNSVIVILDNSQLNWGDPHDQKC